ncbi:unknown [Ruminococcus sp. CAG:624]|nr:unknown [Ruminococcus sp. CAG:624]
MLEVNNICNINENIILKGINKKFWALDSKSGTQYKLNELSFDILSLMNGSKSIGEIIEIQYHKYNVEKDLLTKDILSFVNKSYEKGILVEVK